MGASGAHGNRRPRTSPIFPKCRGSGESVPLSGEVGSLTSPHPCRRGNAGGPMRDEGSLPPTLGSHGRNLSREPLMHHLHQPSPSAARALGDSRSPGGRPANIISLAQPNAVPAARSRAEFKNASVGSKCASKTGLLGLVAATAHPLETLSGPGRWGSLQVHCERPLAPETPLGSRIQFSRRDTLSQRPGPGPPNERTALRRCNPGPGCGGSGAGCFRHSTPPREGEPAIPAPLWTRTHQKQRYVFRSGRPGSQRRKRARGRGRSATPACRGTGD